MDTIIYVRALSNGEWYGGWAPVMGKLVLSNVNGNRRLYVIEDHTIEEDDEYEFFRSRTWVICLLDGDTWKAVAGIPPDVTVDDIFPPMQLKK